MRNLLYVLIFIVIWAIAVSSLIAITSCVKATPIKQMEVAPVPSLTKKDFIAKAIVNKENSRLQRMFIQIMDKGTIIEVIVDGKRWANGAETSKEWWTVEDGLTPPNRFKIYWENGVLKTIDTVEKVKEYKPLGE